MNKIIFIAGLGHSGTTLIDLVLSNHTSIIGFGQIYTVYNELKNNTIKHKNRVCSCGKDITECDYWSRIISTMNQPDVSYQSFYKFILDTIHSEFQNDIYLLDSSKSLESLKNTLRIPNTSIKVLHIFKDVRNWCISNIELHKRKYNKRASPFLTFLLWYNSNKKFQNYLDSNNLQYLNIGYDDFCLNSKKVFIDIFDFLEIGYQEGLANYSNSKSHVVSGNRMRLEPDKNKEIVYDNRWFHRKEWLIPSILLPKIMKYNYENVYTV